jgi:hypothetical protein
MLRIKKSITGAWCEHNNDLVFIKNEVMNPCVGIEQTRCRVACARGIVCS